MPRKKKIKKPAPSAHRAKPKRTATNARRTPARKAAKPAMKRKKDLTLEDIDQKIRINELKHKLDDIAGKETPMFTSDDCPPDLQEAFLNSVVAYETAPVTTDFKRLRKEGVVLPPPDQLSDEDISTKLKELIDRMARRRTYVTHTNHLSERELYEYLWSDGLREEHAEMPGQTDPDFKGGWCIDVLGSGSEEDSELYLKYYADEDYRKYWKKQFPKDKLPKHEDPPYDRDRHLPNMGF
jgi:hypothetical protein